MLVRNRMPERSAETICLRVYRKRRISRKRDVRYLPRASDATRFAGWFEALVVVALRLPNVISQLVNRTVPERIGRRPKSGDRPERGDALLEPVISANKRDTARSRLVLAYSLPHPPTIHLHGAGQNEIERGHHRQRSGHAQDRESDQIQP